MEVTKAVITVGVYTCGRMVVEYLEWYDKCGLVDKLPTSALDEEPDLFHLSDEEREVKFVYRKHPRDTFFTYLSELDHNSVQYAAYIDAGRENVYHYARLPIPTKP